MRDAAAAGLVNATDEVEEGGLAVFRWGPGNGQKLARRDVQAGVVQGGYVAVVQGESSADGLDLNKFAAFHSLGWPLPPFHGGVLLFLEGS